MIEFGKEYYSDNSYFFLKKRSNKIDVYFSVADTITEARNIDELISVPLTSEKIIKRFSFMTKNNELYPYSYENKNAIKAFEETYPILAEEFKKYFFEKILPPQPVCFHESPLQSALKSFKLYILFAKLLL